MASTTLSEEMLEYFDRLTDAEQKSDLQLIKTFADGGDKFRPQTIETYNQELEEADAEIEAGDFVLHEEVMKKYF